MGTELQTIELSTPGKDIESYLSSVHSIPILTPVQERELAQKLYDNDDLDAARQLVLAHLRFCGSYLKNLFRLRASTCRYYSRRECRFNEGG